MKKTILLTTLVLAAMASAETRTASEPSPAVPAKATKAAERTATSASVIGEVLGQNIVIEAGKSVRISAKADFSGADRAAFGVYAEPTVNITKVRISVWWGVPGAPGYSVQEVIRGSNFPFTNAGGGNVSVNGSAMFVDVNNDGDAPITISLLTVYAVAR